VTSGLPLLQRITATGCALSALVAAFLGAGGEAVLGAGEAAREEAVLGAAAACAMLGAAATLGAAAVAAGNPPLGVGPGSLRLALLDALHAADGARVASEAKVFLVV
jgi:hydroxyethylthiazole kinase